MGEINVLGWADNSGVEDGYEVQRTNTPGGFIFYVETIATRGPNATSYSGDVRGGKTYTYRVVSLKEIWR